MLILEPIFEVDLQEEQYGYRPGKSAHDAVRAVHGWLNRGHRQVVDADLSGYYDSIPHHELLKCVARRISDGAMLALIRQWLENPVEETDERGHPKRTTVNKDTGRGTPQGSPLSPLLANLYMRRFVLGWKKQGWEQRLGARIVNYADDYVILCRGSAEEARIRMQKIMEVLKLRVNETKTRTCRVPQESFDFLGYTIGWQCSTRNGRGYIGTRPSQKRITRFCEAISLMLAPDTTYTSVEEMVQELNRKLRGWANYFCLGAVSKAYNAVQRHTCYRLRQWLRRKHKTGRSGRRKYCTQYLHERLGLLDIAKLTPTFPWAKSADS
jgi:group II intron reverse transcriptase/maturase